MSFSHYFCRVVLITSCAHRRIGIFVYDWKSWAVLETVKAVRITELVENLNEAIVSPKVRSSASIQLFNKLEKIRTSSSGLLICVVCLFCFDLFPIQYSKYVQIARDKNHRENRF